MSINLISDMRYLFLIFQFSEAFSQISVSNTTFPKIGDTLKTIFTLNVPGGLNLGTTGGPKIWDFSQLSAGVSQQEVYLNPSAGKDAVSFPEANLIMRSGGQDLYIKSTTTKMEGLGFGGSNPFLDTSIVIKFNRRPVLRRAPVEFISSDDTQGEFRISLGADIIPDTLLSTLPIKPDSVRIQFSNSVRSIVDAYGTLKLQGRNFEVLKEKGVRITEIKLFVKILGLWLDPVALLGGNIPTDFIDLVGKDTTIVYNFYSNVKKEVIVSAEYDPSGTFLGVSFVDLNGKLSLVSNQKPESFRIFPNPFNEFITLSTIENEGRHGVSISDMLGNVVFFDILFFNKGETKQINTSNWPAGVYFLSLINSANKQNTTIQIIKN